MKNLKERLLSLNSGVEFMEGRDKKEIPLNVQLTVENYDYLQGEDGDFAVIIFKEDKDNFYFGSSVSTKKLKLIDDNFNEDEINQMLENSEIIVEFSERKSKNKRKYTDMKFI